MMIGDLIPKVLGTALGPLKVKVWLYIAAGLAFVAFVVIQIADNRDKRMIETAQESGKTEAVAEGRKTTLDQNRSANDAENEIRRGGDAAVDGCVSNARGDSAGCERFAD